MFKLLDSVCLNRDIDVVAKDSIGCIVAVFINQYYEVEFCLDSDSEFPEDYICLTLSEREIRKLK